jgi:hypothetical protein
MRHLLTERTRSIDVGELNRDAAFSGTPMRFPILGLFTTRFKIEYRGSNWPIGRRSQIIRVIWARCNFGGTRPWFICHCEKRVAKLFSSYLGLYLCRKCANLNYLSQLRGRKSRLYNKAQKIRRLLQNEGRPGIDAFPMRSYRMHAKTFEQKITLLQDVENELIAGNRRKCRKQRDRTRFEP